MQCQVFNLQLCFFDILPSLMAPCSLLVLRKNCRQFGESPVALNIFSKFNGHGFHGSFNKIPKNPLELQRIHEFASNYDESANWLGIMSRFVSYVCPLAHRPHTWAIGWDGSTHVSSAMAMARMERNGWDKKCQEAHMSEKIGRSVVDMANSKCRFKWKIFNPVPKKSQQEKA